jgi:hypothetical protein
MESTNRDTTEDARTGSVEKIEVVETNLQSKRNPKHAAF